MHIHTGVQLMIYLFHVQIGASDDLNGTTKINGFPDIRWHQTADIGIVPNFQMRNVFMGTAMDLTDPQSPFGQ